MPDHPDLTAELDAAEDIVTGRTEKVVTEYAWLEPDGTVFELVTFSEEAARVMTASRERYGNPASLVCRTVTYGPWEEMPRDR